MFKCSGWGDSSNKYVIASFVVVVPQLPRASGYLSFRVHVNKFCRESVESTKEILYLTLFAKNQGKIAKVVRA
ncbi:hypothetical protein D3C87_2053200 [compost metagenome]